MAKDTTPTPYSAGVKKYAMTNIAPAVNALLINHCDEFNSDPRIATPPNDWGCLDTVVTSGESVMCQTILAMDVKMQFSKKIRSVAPEFLVNDIPRYREIPMQFAVPEFFE